MNERRRSAILSMAAAGSVLTTRRYLGVGDVIHESLQRASAWMNHAVGFPFPKFWQADDVRDCRSGGSELSGCRVGRDLLAFVVGVEHGSSSFLRGAS